MIFVRGMKESLGPFWSVYCSGLSCNLDGGMIDNHPKLDSTGKIIVYLEL